MDHKFGIASFFVIFMVLVFAVGGSPLDFDVSIYSKVTGNAKHWWNFDEATSLYSIVDKVSEKRASIREGGAKLTRLGRLTNNYLTLEGRSSSIELGRFDGCIGDILECTKGLTFSLWLRFREVPGEAQYILGNAVPGTNENGFAFMRTKNGEMRVYFIEGSNEYYATYSANAETWLHHVIAWDGRKITVYVDGKKLMNLHARKRRHSREETNAYDGRERRGIRSRLFTLGGHGFKIDADYDNVIIWNRGLNETEAAVMYYRDLSNPVLNTCKSTASSVCLIWTMPNDAFKRIRKLFATYQYLLQTDGPLRMELNMSSNSKCIDRLGSLTTYIFAVEASIGDHVTKLKSQQISCRTTNGVPNAPKVSVGITTSTSIEAIWETPSPANGAITAYSMVVLEAEKDVVKFRFKWGAHESLPGRIGTYRINVTRLTPGTQHIIQVRAISEVGKSYPASIAVTTKGEAVSRDTIKAVPIIGGMKIFWSSIPNAISYKLFLKSTNSNVTIFDVHSNSTELNSLEPLTTYVVDIRPVFKSGLGPGLERKINVRTTDGRCNPDNVKATAIGWDKIVVTWSPLMAENATYIVFLRAENRKEISMETMQDHVNFKLLDPLTKYEVYIQTRFSWGLGPRMYTRVGVKTKDLNECQVSSGNKCDKNADCFNVESSYLCQCRPGYVGNGFSCRPTPENAKESDFCEAQTFRDVQWPRIFKSGTAVRICPNGTVGFASRGCLYDSINERAVYDLPNLSDCVSEDVVELGVLMENSSTPAFAIGNQLTKVTTRRKLYGGDVKKTVVYYQNTVEEKLQSESLVHELGQPLLDVASNLLNLSVVAAWKDLPKNGRSDGATTLFNGLENLAEKISKNFRNSSFKETFSTPNVEMQIQRLDKSNQSLHYVQPFSPANGNREEQSSISLPTKEIASQTGNGAVDAIFFTYANIDKILGMEKKPNEENKGSKKILNSKVVSAVIVGARKVFFNSPAVLVLPHLKQERVLNTSCVFWNISTSPQSKWLDTGCFVNYTDINQTVCHCYHLTNFAVLMTVSTMPAQKEVRSHHFALRIITIIGLTISILAMSIAFVTFCSFRFLRSPRTMYHKHLLASLILANLLFLVGIDKTENEIACSVIAVFLHYFFVVAFVWMAMEGILLYFMLKKIFSSRNFLKRRRCLVLCWVLPALYVGLLSSLKLEHYGNSNYCWISRAEGFIWSFVAPVSFTLLVNFTVMGFAFQVMSDKRNKTPDDGTVSDIWYWLKGCLVLTCLLGVTWLVGVFYIDSNTIAFAYVFTLLNALQGLFIFIFHCLIDSRVRSEYMRLIRCQKRYEYNEKAGYSSSMKLRKLSGSIKSLGSLDRSLSHSSAKRTMSNSLDRSLLRQHNGSISEFGRFTLQRSISSTKSEKSDKTLPEMQPLVQRSFSIEDRESVLPENNRMPGEIHLHDEKAGSSYSSVFDSESEEKRRQSRGVRDSLCLADPTMELSKRRWDTPTHGSDSGVSVRSGAFQGDSFESNTDQRDFQVSETQLKDSYSITTFHLDTGREPVLLLKSRNSMAENSESKHSQLEQEAFRETVKVLSNENAKEVAQEPKLAFTIIEDKFEMQIGVLYEEAHTSSVVEDKRTSIDFDRLGHVMPDDEMADNVFEVACTSELMPPISPVRKNRFIQFEVEELPKVEQIQPFARCGSPDKKERAETSLRIGVPRLISVSSVESEPISPIIISINPADREFSMLEAEMEFSEETMSNHSENES